MQKVYDDDMEKRIAKLKELEEDAKNQVELKKKMKRIINDANKRRQKEAREKLEEL